MTKEVPLYRNSLEASKWLEKANLTYTYEDVTELFPELNLEEAQLMQSIVFKEAGHFAMIYNPDAMTGLFFMMDNSILCLERGINLNMELDEDTDHTDEEI